MLPSGTDSVSVAEEIVSRVTPCGGYVKRRLVYQADGVCFYSGVTCCRDFELYEISRISPLGGIGLRGKILDQDKAKCF